jgi:hypothetical protein
MGPEVLDHRLIYTHHLSWSHVLLCSSVQLVKEWSDLPKLVLFVLLCLVHKVAAANDFPKVVPRDGLLHKAVPRVFFHLPEHRPSGGSQVSSHEHDGVAGPDGIGSELLLHLRLVLGDCVQLGGGGNLLDKLIVDKDLEEVKRSIATRWKLSEMRRLELGDLFSEAGWLPAAPVPVLIVDPRNKNKIN